MGAIWGFTGRSDKTLAATMGDALRHRGGETVDNDEGTLATIHYRHAHRPGQVGIGGGLLELPSDNLTLALCGWLSEIEGVAQLGRSRDGNGNGNGDDHQGQNQRLRQLAALYRRDGLAVTNHLRGAFVLAIRDGDDLHLVRDGAGNRTVYYGRGNGRWLFGVEPKAICSAPEFRKQIRYDALAQYLACSFVHGEATMMDGLFELQAGHTVTLRGSEPPRLDRWFRFESHEPPTDVITPGGKPELADDEAFVAGFRKRFEQAVAERIPRNEPVGVFLSGGLDSSIVTAELARQIGGKNVRTWAIHFGPKYHHELDFARAVAERCGTVHEEVLIQPRNFIPRLRKMIWHLDDPIGDPITQPNFELAAHVSRDVRFIFNGEGGDPCFGGPKNIPMMLHHWYGGVERGPSFRERRYLESYRRAWDEIAWLLSDEVRREIDIERDLDGVFTPYLSADHPRLFLNRLTAVNIREKGAHLIQPKVERMLGAFGVTPLAPLFDERVINYSFEMPPRFKLSRGVEKVVLKRAFENELPRDVIERPKSGMRVPVHYWFRNEMRRYARKILSKRAVRRVGLFEPERVKQLLDYDIEEGRGRYGLRLWMLITFELWRRIVIEGETP